MAFYGNESVVEGQSIISRGEIYYEYDKHCEIEVNKFGYVCTVMNWNFKKKPRNNPTIMAVPLFYGNATLKSGKSSAGNRNNIR